jgi:hypothetical protein
MTLEKEIDAFCNLGRSRYGVLKSLELSRSFGPEGSSGYTLRMVLVRNDLETPGLNVTFEGVRNLKIENIEHMDVLVLDITSIRERQLEGLNYQVVENEEDAISFLCRDFKAFVSG